MTPIGCRVFPDRGGLKIRSHHLWRGGSPQPTSGIMASSAQSAVTRDPSAVDDAATVPRYGLRSARWRLMALSLVRRWVCAERRRPPLHCEWVLPERGCREGAVLTYPFKVKSLRRVWAIPTTAAGRPSIAAGRLQRGDAPVPQRRRPRRHASACRNSAHKRSDRNATADRISFRGGRKRSGLARCGCLA